MPSLNVRALAKMIRRPNSRAKVLTQQKYPQAGDQRFRTPYYQPALKGIRAYYRSGNDPSRLSQALNELSSIRLETRRHNNARALDKFRVNAALAGRQLQVLPNSRLATTTGAVTLRLAADIRAEEAGKPLLLYFHFAAQKLEPETARITIELAYWVATRSGLDVPIQSIEFIDLFSGVEFRQAKSHKDTVAMIRDEVKHIEAIWDEL